MKTYFIHSQNNQTVLEKHEVSRPEPKSGEIVVRVRSASLNRGELMAAIGHFSATDPRPAGIDGAGQVHAVGDGVDGFDIGDRVMFRARGAFAEYVAVVVEQAVPVPDALSWEQAGAVPTVFVTAYESVRQFGDLRKRDWLLVAGASSGVGVACIQIAKYLGARVIGTSGSAEKLERLKSSGLDVGIVSRGSDFQAPALNVTGGRGVDVAVNLVGGTAFPGCLASLANQGRLAIIGYVDGVLKSQIDLEAVHGKRLQIFGVSNTHLTAKERAVAMQGFVQEVLPGLADGRIVPVVDRVFPFGQLPAAKDYVESNAQVGKVVVTLS